MSGDLPGFRDDPHDPMRFGQPEELQRWQDERDEARAVLSFRATLVRGAVLLAVLAGLLWAAG